MKNDVLAYVARYDLQRKETVTSQHGRYSHREGAEYPSGHTTGSHKALVRAAVCFPVLFVGVERICLTRTSKAGNTGHIKPFGGLLKLSVRKILTSPCFSFKA